MWSVSVLLLIAGCGASFELRDPIGGACRDTLTRWEDADGDGWGAGDGSQVCDDVEGLVANGMDCDDADPSVGPGVPGASCPADLGEPVAAYVSAGAEHVVVRPPWGAVDAPAARRLCDAWGDLGAPQGAPDLAPRLLDARDADGLAGAWAAPVEVRWVGDGGAGLAGSWSETLGWTGTWSDAFTPWCAGAPPSPQDAAPWLNPADALDLAAWDALLADLVAVVVGGDAPCLRLADADAVACTRTRPAPEALAGRAP